ncbi:MAG: hypothetical protein KDA92_02350 [Planctomycetales bacterium]|nr:hypothetical protein [Planctomycetales bacterium]MCA9167235.1 hypothetical protein [Planctomycetales bacterium]
MLEVLRHLPPGVPLMLGALLTVCLPARVRRPLLVALPVLSLWHMAGCFELGDQVHVNWLGLRLTPIRVDRLALAWAYIFHFAALVVAIYQWADEHPLTPAMSLSYAGGAIAAVFAGDLLSLFLGWEWTALASVFLVWNGRQPGGTATGIRYLLWQVGSGVLLLSGAILLLSQTGELGFGGPHQVGIYTAQVSTWAGRLILIAFAIKAGFPLLNTWLLDAYPAASPAGTVVLSAFTTKLAIYALLRGFAGWEPLIAVGCVMAIVPLIQALIEDDARRTLVYCLINQLGFMVVAIGVGTPLAVNGVAAHAIGHILYKSLLLMAIGSTAQLADTTRCSKLYQVAKVLPWVAVLYMVGAAAMALPLTCGFVTKSISLSAIAEAHRQTAWLILWAATAGVVFVCACRLPYVLFFGPKSSHDQVERHSKPAVVPTSHYVAMTVTAIACITLGVAPEWLLYRHLPNPIEYHPYTMPHVVGQLQLIAWAIVAFSLLARFELYPVVTSGFNLDVDWLWRRGLKGLMEAAWRGSQAIQTRASEANRQSRNKLLSRLAYSFHEHGPRGLFASTGQMACWAAILLIIFLIAYYRK